MPEIAYAIDATQVECHPYDPATNTDIEDLGDGWMVTIWIPNDKRPDVDRNDTARREVTGIIEAAIAANEGG